MEDGQQPATQKDIAHLRTEMRAMEEHLVEAFRDGQAEILKAFYNFGESNNKRVTHGEAN